MSGCFFFIFMQPDKAPPIISRGTTSPRVRFTHKYGSVLVSVASRLAWTPAGSTVEATLSNFLVSFDFFRFSSQTSSHPCYRALDRYIRDRSDPSDATADWGEKTVVHKLGKCGRFMTSEASEARTVNVLSSTTYECETKEKENCHLPALTVIVHPNKSKHIQHAACDGLLFCPLDYTAAWLNMILTNSYDFVFALLTRGSTFLSGRRKRRRSHKQQLVFSGWNKKCSKRARWVHQFSLLAQRGNHCNPLCSFSAGCFRFLHAARSQMKTFSLSVQMLNFFIYRLDSTVKFLFFHDWGGSFIKMLCVYIYIYIYYGCQS